MKIWRILFGSNYTLNQKFCASGCWIVLKKYNIYVTLMIYYGFHNSKLIAQFKRIIINFISIISLQIVPFRCTVWKAPFRTVSGCDELMPQTWMDFLATSWSFTQSIICWRVGTGSLKLVSLFASGKPSTTLSTYVTKHLNTALSGFLRLTSVGWHFEVQSAGIGRTLDFISNNWTLTPSVKCTAEAWNDSNEF